LEEVSSDLNLGIGGNQILLIISLFASIQAPVCKKNLNKDFYIVAYWLRTTIQKEIAELDIMGYCVLTVSLVIVDLVHLNAKSVLIKVKLSLRWLESS